MSKIFERTSAIFSVVWVSDGILNAVWMLLVLWSNYTEISKSGQKVIIAMASECSCIILLLTSLGTTDVKREYMGYF